MSSVDARLLQALGGAAVHMPVGDLARDLGETSEAIYLAMEALVGAGFVGSACCVMLRFH